MPRESAARNPRRTRFAAQAAGHRRIAAACRLAALLGLLPPSAALGSGLNLSPDGRYLVYETNYPYSRILSRRLADGLEVEIAPPPGLSSAGGPVISPNSGIVLFLAPGLTGQPPELWAVPIEGPSSVAVKLSIEPDEPYGVNAYRFSGDGAEVLYTMPRVDPFRTDLFLVPVEGPAGASSRVNAPLPDGGWAAHPIPLLGTRRVVYLAGMPSPPPDQGIWLGDPEALTAVRIGHSPPPRTTNYSWIQVTPDEQRVVWTAYEFEDPWLYSAPVSDPPGPTIQLNPDLPPGGVVSTALVGPASDVVAYLANQVDPQKGELFSVPVAGPSSASTNLSGFSFTSLSRWNTPFGFSEDGAWVLYVADREVAGRRDLYRVAAAGPASSNLRINPSASDGAEVYGFEQLPGTTEVIFPVGEVDPDLIVNCYRGDLEGATGNAVPLWTDPLPWVTYRAPCEPVPAIGGVLVGAGDPLTGTRALWLAHDTGPPDLRPLKLFDSSEFEPSQDPFWGDIVKTSDGRFVVYTGTRLGGSSGIWVQPLPFFWDGFESGGSAHWSAVAP